MTYALVGLLVAFFLWYDHRLETHRRAHREHVERLISQKPEEVLELIRLVENLCQRIQAPHVAVVDHSLAQSQEIVVPEVIGMDTDQPYESKEELAAQMWADEVAA